MGVPLGPTIQVLQALRRMSLVGAVVKVTHAPGQQQRQQQQGRQQQQPGHKFSQVWLQE